jgi:hypothetical protein
MEDLRGIYTGYSFERKLHFDGGDAELQRIFDVGWRTATLCAYETYVDCPYYEQLQYVGYVPCWRFTQRGRKRTDRSAACLGGISSIGPRDG